MESRIEGRKEGGTDGWITTSSVNFTLIIIPVLVGLSVNGLGLSLRVRFERESRHCNHAEYVYECEYVCMHRAMYGMDV